MSEESRTSNLTDGSERVFNLVASALTITGFALSMAKTSGLVEPEVVTSASSQAIATSWMFVLVAAFVCATVFGYGFALIITRCERFSGRISLIVSVPIVGMISGFQTGAVTFLLAKFFGIVDGLFFLLILSFVVSCVLESLFILRQCQSQFGYSSGQHHRREGASKPNGGAPRFSPSLSLVNATFFGFGASVFLVDAGLLPDSGAVFLMILFFLFVNLACVIAAFSVFEFLKASDHKP